MKITHLSCFTTHLPSSGNLAVVVEDFIGDDLAKQRLAKELNLPVTVFIEQGDYVPVFRFFYPETEMSMCIHGSLAAAAVLMKSSEEQELKAINREGRLLQIRSHQDQYALELGEIEILPHRIGVEEIAALLGLENDTAIDLNLPCLVASVGSPKLLIPIKTLSRLESLQPNFPVIKAWSLANRVNGVYVYTYVPSDEYDFYARAFNPKTGHNEDAATGIAVGALLGALGGNHTIRVGQGKNLGRPSLIRGSIQDEKVSVGGRVVFL